jgi:hypothetical protein|tara:strand:+ start:855 stop:1397 length:543 start_codon:yes stop_codon:yes gene_type:complete
MVRGGVGGGTVYSGGGYWGGESYGYGGGVFFGAIGVDVSGRAEPSRPFGYVVGGFGRDYRTVSTGSVSGGRTVEESRYGARYQREAYHGTYYEQSSYADSYYEESSYEAAYGTDLSYGRRDDRRDGERHDCGCDRSGPPPHAYEAMPGPGYYGDLPPPDHVAPVAPPPHHNYRQEPGERG